MTIPTELREAAGRAAHEAYRAERAPPTKLHSPEDCPCKDGHDEPALPEQPAAIYVWCLRCHRQIERGTTGCPACRAGLRAWPDLTNAQREEFRASQAPALALLAPVLAECAETLTRLKTEGELTLLRHDGKPVVTRAWLNDDGADKLLAHLAALGVKT